MTATSQVSQTTITSTTITKFRSGLRKSRNLILFKDVKAIGCWRVSWRHKRSRQNDHKDSDVDWSGGEGSIETETDETPGVRKRPLVSRDDTLRSPSPGFQWDNDSNGDTSVTPSDADGSESGFPSSDGPDSSLDLDWDSFVCVREDSLPASNWEAEFLEHKNKVMAATNYKGLFYDTSIQDDEGQEEDPWYPYDPENVLSSPAALADDTVMPIESLDEELTICYGMVSFCSRVYLYQWTYLLVKPHQAYLNNRSIE